jgi:hypothetical protein
MEEQRRPSVYAAPGIPYVIKGEEKPTITKVIADVWGIPEEKVLSNTSVTEKEHPSPFSSKGERLKVPGERNPAYVNARKCYFYVMIEIKHYKWPELRLITGRKIAIMRYSCRKAKEHMALEKDYMEKVQEVLRRIESGNVIFPKLTITLEVNATVTKE